MKKYILILTTLVCAVAFGVTRLGDSGIVVDSTTISNISSSGSLTLDPGTAGVILTDLTATTVPYLGASKEMLSSAVTPTELGYVGGVTSAIQSQIDSTTTAHGVTGDVVGTGGAQTLSTKTIDLPAITTGMIMANQAYLNFRESGSVNYVGFRAPASLASDTDYILPSVDGTSGQFLQTNGSEDLVWATAATASGAKNYIDDASAELESSVGGWTTDDGVGGAAAYLTLSQETTIELAGSGSLKMAKSANDATAEFIKVTTVAIDLADRGKALFGSFSYDASDAAYVSSDFLVEVYDNTNAAVLYSGVAADLEILNSAGRFNFVTYTESTTASIELRLKVNSANASAYDLYFDEFKFGPASSIQPPIVTEWRSFTPTGTWVSGNETYTGEWRRVGDSVEVTTTITIGAGGPPTSATLDLDLPASMVIDTNKLPSTTFDLPIGLTGVNDGGAVAYDGITVYKTTTTVSPRARANANPDQATTITETIPITWANTDKISVSYKVPIVGWGVGAIASNNELSLQTIDVDGVGNGGTVITANVTDIDFTEVTDSHGAWDGDSFTAPKTGKYRISGIVRATTSIAASIQIYIDTVADELASYNSGAATGHAFNWEGTLQKDEVLTLRSTISGTLSNSATTHFLRISSLPDYTVLGAVKDQVLSVSGAGNGGGAMTQDVTDIDFTEISDTHGAWDGDSFTAPKSQYYMVTGSIQITAAGLESITAYVNTSAVKSMGYSGSSDVQHNFSGLISLDKGDVLTFRLSTTKTLDNVTTGHWIDIVGL